MAIILKSSIGGLDHPSVQSVIEIAEEILNENRILNTKILYNLAKKRLKIPRKGLLTIIQMLINKKILVEGSKFTKETVLSNPYRNSIYNFINKNLGAHFSILRKSVYPEIGSKITSAGQLIWHLEMLLKFNYIKKLKFKKYTIFIPNHLNEELGIYIFLLRDKINKKIINFLIKYDKIQKSDMYKLIEENREKVYYRINDLIGHNLLLISNEENKEICLNSDNKDILVNILKKISNLNEGNFIFKNENREKF